MGLAWVHGVFRLFSAGAVIYEAHHLFLRYYAREWQGVQIAGVNGCNGEDLIANADIFVGQTFCNKPENFVPWVEVYRHHPVAAAIYYGVALTIIVVIGMGISAAQRRLGSRRPFGGTIQPSPEQSEHLQ